MYTVFMRPDAIRDLEMLPEKHRKQVGKAIDKLEENPRHGAVKKLEGDVERYRARCGKYRIIFTIDDAAKSATITRIRDRKDVYRNLE
jgi:mRNA-degrading endonuclease RelE of RelBE toxin-antitoxin system